MGDQRIRGLRSNPRLRVVEEAIDLRASLCESFFLIVDRSTRPPLLRRFNKRPLHHDAYTRIDSEILRCPSIESNDARASAHRSAHRRNECEEHASVARDAKQIAVGIDCDCRHGLRMKLAVLGAIIGCFSLHRFDQSELRCACHESWREVHALRVHHINARGKLCRRDANARDYPIFDEHPTVLDDGLRSCCGVNGRIHNRDRLRLRLRWRSGVLRVDDAAECERCGRSERVRATNGLAHEPHEWSWVHRAAPSIACASSICVEFSSQPQSPALRPNASSPRAMRAKSASSR